MFDFSSPSLPGLLGQSDREFLATTGMRRSYCNGEVIHERGQTKFPMSVVVSGKVRFERLFGDGRQVLMAIASAGQNYGDQGGPDETQYTHRATAIGDTEIDHYTGEAFAALLERPEIVCALYDVATFRYGRALDLLNDVRALPAEVRVAKLLMAMRASAGGANRLECVQEDIANLLGMSTVTLTKALKALKSGGLIETGYRQVTISDTGKMHDLIAEWS
ncbi:MAG: Crp/Fnr family transcriptional regulator [Novosphingobium sp.]|nr:Crp/Fnr family transcriptional regulator [Novosphingobium sp.]